MHFFDPHLTVSETPGAATGLQLINTDVHKEGHRQIK